MPPGGMETELGQGGRGERVNGREGPSESCHMTPEPIWVTGLMKTNDAAAPPPPIHRNAFTPGLSAELERLSVM